MGIRGTGDRYRLCQEPHLRLTKLALVTGPQITYKSARCKVAPYGSRPFPFPTPGAPHERRLVAVCGPVAAVHWPHRPRIHHALDVLSITRESLMRSMLVAAFALLCVILPARADWPLDVMNKQIEQTNVIVSGICSGTPLRGRQPPRGREKGNRPQDRRD